MRRVKRAALSIKPRQPYIDWANGLDEGGVKLGTEFTPEGTIYLIDDLSEGSPEFEILLKSYYDVIFEEELNAWHRLEEDWPQERDFALFQAWFEVEIHSLVLDLKGGWVWTERYENYWRKCSSSGAPSVVMVDAVQYRQGDNFSVKLARLRRNKQDWNGLGDTLVRSGVIEIVDILRDLVQKMAFASDEQAIQALPA